MKTPVWLGIAAAMVTLAGCAGHESAPPDASTVESFRLLMHPPPDLALAEHRLIQRCMRATGFQYPDVVARHDEPSKSLLDIPPPFMAEQARLDGYDKIIKRPEDVDAVEEYTRSLDPADRRRFMNALNDEQSAKITVTLPGGTTASTASRGCVADARRATYGSGEKFLLATFVPQIAQGRVARADDDPEFKLAVQGYAECVNDKGYPVRSPTEAIELAQAYHDSNTLAPARERGIALAIADATCQADNQVHEKYLAAANDVAMRWIKENKAMVLDAAAAQRAAMDNAGKILREAE